MNYLFYKKKFPTFCKMYFSWIKNYEQIEYYNNSITHVFPIELNEDFFKKSLKDFIDEYICGIGSGFIYVDGKGYTSLFAKIFSIVRSVGRENDLLVLNYMTKSFTP